MTDYVAKADAKQIPNATPEDWLAIDRKWELLPGDQGEHDFLPANTFADTYQRLASYAENCGGLAIRRSRSIELSCSAGFFILEFGGDCDDRCIKVRYGNGSVYWDASKPRRISWGYQSSNVD